MLPHLLIFTAQIKRFHPVARTFMLLIVCVVELCTSPEMIDCEDGTCIPKLWECNGKINCPTGVDEANCSKCVINIQVILLCSYLFCSTPRSVSDMRDHPKTINHSSVYIYNFVLVLIILTRSLFIYLFIYWIRNTLSVIKSIKSFSVAGSPIKRQSSIRNLGVHLESKMSSDKQVS